MMIRSTLLGVVLLLLLVRSAIAADVFSTDAQFCSGRPWIDVTCPLGGAGTGADPTGVADSTAAINAATAAAITNGWPVLFPAGTYKVGSGLVWDYQGQAGNGFEVMSRGATLDGRTVASGPVLQVQCSGGTTASPILCRGLRISGAMTVLGAAANYTVVLGKTDLSDRHDGARVEHLVAKNTGAAGGAGGMQVNYLTDGDLWLSGSTSGGSSSVAAVALEQVQSSLIGGYGSALGASAPGLLLENGASNSNSFVGFAYDPNDATCIAITSASAVANSWLAPNLPCNTATAAPTTANKNALIGPTFSGTNRGPISTGISIIGRGSVHRYNAPTVAAQTLFGSDDGTIFSSANATGASTGYAGATLTLTLPDPMQVGSGWSVALVSDGAKAIVAQPPANRFVLARGQQLSSLSVGASNNKSLDYALLVSDGATGFRLATVSQAAGLLNGLETGFPATWMFLPGPGYAATVADNGEVLSSAQTTAGLTVTLPQTTSLAPGWSVGFSQDNDKPISVAVNGTNGGQIMRAGAQLGQTSLATLLDHQVITLYFDGTNFREVSPPPSKRIDATSFGAQCGASVDATAALQLADNYFTAAGGGGTITVSCPLRLTGTAYLDDYVQLIGEGPIYYRGMMIRATNGGIQTPTWPPPSGPAIDCGGTVSQGYNACVMIRGIGVKIGNINFGNIQPTPPGSGFNWTPTAYPYVISTLPSANANGFKLFDLSFTASTNCINVEGITNYNTQGIGAAQWTISDIWENGCFNNGIRIANVDNTGRVSNIDEDFWWYRNNIAVGYYVENNKVGLNLCYAANTEFVNYEWFWDKYAIQFTNCSVTGTLTNTAAAYNLQFTNSDFNLACQAVALGSQGSNVLINTAIFTNVIAYQDNSWCGNSQVYQHPNTTGNAFFDFSCIFCDAKLIGMRVGAVDTLAAAGPSGNLTIMGGNVNSYSTFTNGQPALKIPASAHVVAACMNDFGAWVPANGNAGPLYGPGVDGTQGVLQPCYSGGGAHPGGGSVLLTSTPSTSSGYAEFYYDPLAPSPTSSGPVMGPSKRLGFAGFCVPGVGCNYAADHDPVYIKAHASDYSGTGPVLRVDTDGAHLLLNVNPLPISCAGLPTGTVWVNGASLAVCP